LSTVQLPIEQFTLPMLQSANNSMGWSVRSWGHQNVHELQVMVFMSACDACTLISQWDFGVDELNEILREPMHPPFAQIMWGYSPYVIEYYLERAPDWLKPNLQQLLDSIKPKPHGESKP
jgi:hypothetical protein